MRPTCIKLINTSENRYTGEANVNAVKPVEIQPSTNKPRLRSLSTTGKVIVEMSNNKKMEKRSADGNWNVQSTDGGSDSEIIVAKTPKKKKNGLGNDTVPTVATPTPKSSKQKKSKATPAKSIVAPSLNSDDDSETKSTKKEKVPTSKTPKQSKKKRPASSASVHDATPTVQKGTKTVTAPASCPANSQRTEFSQQSTKKRKIDFNNPEPVPSAHVMATRNKRKPTM